MRALTYLIQCPKGEVIAHSTTSSIADLRRMGNKVIGIQTQVDESLIRRYPSEPPLTPPPETAP